MQFNSSLTSGHIDKTISRQTLVKNQNYNIVLEHFQKLHACGV